MKIRTVLAAAFGAGVGYVLGARAGRDKFDEMKSQAQRIVNDPDVRQKVADLPNQVRENLPKAQAKVSDTIKGATDKVQSGTDSDSSSTTSTVPDPVIVPEPVVVGDAGLGDAGLGDAGLAGESSLGESDLLGDADVLAEPIDLPATDLPPSTDFPESSETFEVSTAGEVTETNAFDSGEVSGLDTPATDLGTSELDSGTTSEFDEHKHV